MQKIVVFIYLFIFRVESSLWNFRELLEGILVIGKQKKKQTLNSHPFTLSLWRKTAVYQNACLVYSCAPGSFMESYFPLGKMWGWGLGLH